MGREDASKLKSSLPIILHPMILPFSLFQTHGSPSAEDLYLRVPMSRVVQKPLNHPREGGGVRYSLSRLGISLIQSSRHWACPSGSKAFALRSQPDQLVRKLKWHSMREGRRRSTHIV
jgi:hypothetical protein